MFSPSGKCWHMLPFVIVQTPTTSKEMSFCYRNYGWSSMRMKIEWKYFFNMKFRQFNSANGQFNYFSTQRLFNEIFTMKFWTFLLEMSESPHWSNLAKKNSWNIHLIAKRQKSIRLAISNWMKINAIEVRFFHDSNFFRKLTLSPYINICIYFSIYFFWWEIWNTLVLFVFDIYS